MEFKRKQKVLRQKFWFRFIVLAFSILGSYLYVKYNDKTDLWGVIIGICGSALVWSLVELVDFFVNTFYQYESERNEFFGFVFEYFKKIKQVIRANFDKELPMHEIRKYVNELYEEMNNYIFSNNVYPISKEFYECSNYIERMYWKFDACCIGIYDNCEEKNDYYKKLYDAIILVQKDKEPTSKRFFDGMNIEKLYSEITNIELSFDKYKLPDGLIEEDVIGNLNEKFTVPGNIRETTTFIPDIVFYKLNKESKSNVFKTPLCLLFRKVE